MLIRIAPDMFIDAKYECLTATEVRKEILQTQKFKDQYPWRIDYKSNIIPNNSFINKDVNFQTTLDVIKNKIYVGTINRLTGRFFDLSRVDRFVAAYAVNYNLQISSTDRGLIDFLNQEFDTKNKYPLEIINMWVEKKILTWNDERHKIIEEWIVNKEPEQPQSAVHKFNKLTGYSFK